MVLALLVGGYIALGLALYGGVLVGPLLPFLLPCLLPLALVPLGALGTVSVWVWLSPKHCPLPVAVLKF